MRSTVEHFINRCWYPSTATDYRYSKSWVRAMRPLQWLYHKIQLRRYCQRSIDTNQQPPIIAIGNISVGGTGKTPLLIALGRQLIEQRLNIAVISRGYGGRQRQFPHRVELSDDAKLVGDEPLLIAKTLNCPVIIAPVRTLALELIKPLQLDLVLSDDGLQHYAMARRYEICVIDQQRQFGNGKCLPAGPLREPIERLNSVDYIAVNGDNSDIDIAGCQTPILNFQLMATGLLHCKSGERIIIANNRLNIADSHPLSKYLHSQQKLHACAGIGNPQRFYDSLADLGFDIIPHALGDHRALKPADFDSDGQPIIITAKDSVKLQSLFNDKRQDDFMQRLWVLEIAVDKTPSFKQLIQELTQLCHRPI